MENLQENAYDGVSFNKVPNLYWNFAIKIIHYDTFSKMYQTLTILKNHILRKKSIVHQLPNKVAAL